MGTPWTIEKFMRNWIGSNEVLDEVRNHRKTASSKLSNEQKKQERKLDTVTKQIAKLAADKTKIEKLIADIKSEKAALNKE